MTHVFAAVTLFVRFPRLWRYALRPLLWAAVVFALITGATYSVAVPAMTEFERGLAVPEGVGRFVAIGLFVIAWIYLSGMLYLAIAGLLGTFLWDALSAEVERLVTCATADPPRRPGILIADGVVRLVFATVLGLCGFCLGSVSGGVAGVLCAGLVGLFDYTAGAFLRRGQPFSAQARVLFRMSGWASFVLVAGIISLVPIVNVLAAPLLVAAGTIMVVRSRRLASAT